MRIAITGVTLTGNMGGVAMLKTTMQELRKKYGDAKFDLLSISPHADLKAAQLENLNITPVNYVSLICLYMPLCFVFWPLRKLSFVRFLFCKSKYFQAINNVDFVVDLSGIAFVDGRGLPLLAYNTAVCLPSLFLNKPVFKLAQALGPFESVLNKVAAKFIFKNCHVVIARGDETYAFLKGLKLKNCYNSPDITFLLHISEEDIAAANKICVEYNVKKNSVVISPSEVVRRLCERKGIDFKRVLLAIIDRALKHGESILLLPHSLAEDSSKNNDIKLCHDIYEAHFKDNTSVSIITKACDPNLLRAIIAKAKIFIGCRFHSVVSALATATPSLVFGWSHKYLEMARPLLSNKWILDYTELENDQYLKKLDQLLIQHLAVKNQIRSALPGVVENANANFSLIYKDLS